MLIESIAKVAAELQKPGHRPRGRQQPTRQENANKGVAAGRAVQKTLWVVEKDEAKGENGKFADKPGFVERADLAINPPGNHSSGRRVTTPLKQPTRGLREQRQRPPIWPCPGWGLPCRPCHHVRGGLLPRRFTLA